jgi:aryl-alcohol dehydrogenase-like predicted oxidoreductase
MRYRTLGSSGLKVSEIGFGAWGIGGDAYGPIEISDASNAVSAAYDAGINFFDTADLYGDGQSERIIGSTIKANRADIVIATKVGFLAHDGPQNYRPDYVEQALAKSLTRLETDWLDVFMLHSPPVNVFMQEPELLSRLNELKNQGIIRAIGISCRSPEIALEMANSVKPDVLEVNFNLIDQRASTSGFLDRCSELNIGVVARTPFAFGFLTGKLAPGVEFPPDDHRSKWSREQLDTWARAPQLFAKLNNGTSRSIAELSLLFCLSHSAVSSAIPGIMSADEAIQNSLVGNMAPLTPIEIETAKEIYSQHEFFVRPRDNRHGIEN